MVVIVLLKPLSSAPPKALTRVSLLALYVMRQAQLHLTIGVQTLSKTPRQKVARRLPVETSSNVPEVALLHIRGLFDYPLTLACSTSAVQRITSLYFMQVQKALQRHNRSLMPVSRATLSV